MKNDNELIAEFMGFKYYADYGHHRDVYYEEAVIDPADPDFVQSPHWNESWDWLMPVVEKISEYRLAYPEQADKVCNAKIVIRIKYLYPLVVEFVKFLNSQSQSK